MYRRVPDTLGYFGIFEQERPYRYWIWKDLIPIQGERPNAFFRRRLFASSALSSTVSPSNVTTLVFTDKQCYVHQEENGKITSFYYNHIEGVQLKRQTRFMDVVLESGRIITLPMMNEKLASYLMVLARKKRHADWIDEQQEVDRKQTSLLQSIVFASGISLLILPFLLQGLEFSGTDIFKLGVMVYIPIQILAFTLVKLYENLQA